MSIYIPIEATQPDPVVLSDLTGNKRAVLVGIAYTQTDNLAAPSKDVARMKKLLMEHYQFSEENIKVLQDNGSDNGSDICPTRDNILDAMIWLVRGNQKNDSLVFHYTGHGTRKRDGLGDEWDDYDEAICPVDGGVILDDDLYDILVRKLKKGCRLTTFFNCCHSGTILDHPYEFDERGKLIPHSPSSLGGSFGPSGIYKLLTPYNKKDAKPSIFNPELNLKKRWDQKDIVCFSACRDTEFSYAPGATSLNFSFGTAFSIILCAFLKNNSNPTYLKILKDFRKGPKKVLGISQHPQLSSAHDLDLNSSFSM